jgi:branched-chain amino acid transport system substrate-binding protein
VSTRHTETGNTNTPLEGKMRSKKPAAAVAVAVCTSLGLAACAGAGGPSATGSKVSNDKVVLGLLNDQSGVYKDLSGPNSKVAIEMAIADYKAKYGDRAVAKTIEIVSADHQNKPDLANTKAQEMYDRQNADIILDVPTSSAALAVANVAKAKKKLFIDVGAATTALTGASCNKYTFHWAYDTFMLANGTGAAMVRQGGKNWSIVYPDYAFGQDMNRSFSVAVKGAGGEVRQSIKTPFPNDNFATFITKAGSTNPQVIGTMAAGGDLINFVKQFNQAGMRDKATLAVGLMFITDIHSLGVDQFAGTTFTDAWYWNFDAQNRAWADKFKARTNTRPSFAHAGNYSAAFQYLEAVQRAGTDSADAVVKELEGKELKDIFLRNGMVRAADHRVLHDAYLAKVKTKAQVRQEWDYEQILTTIPADKAFGPVSDACKM